jgi:hypothetical protein
MVLNSIVGKRELSGKALSNDRFSKWPKTVPLVGFNPEDWGRLDSARPRERWEKIVLPYLPHHRTKVNLRGML